MIQADDLTGAADTAVGFAAAGLRTAVLPWRGAVPASPPDAAVLAFDTASRDLDAGAAADRAGQVARWFARHCDERAWLYKKLDSTLRGNAAAELAAVERALCAAGRCPSQVVVAPAYPALGRTTVDGRQCWDGEGIDIAARLGIGRSSGSSSTPGRPRTSKRWPAGSRPCRSGLCWSARAAWRRRMPPAFRHRARRPGRGRRAGAGGVRKPDAAGRPPGGRPEPVGDARGARGPEDAGVAAARALEAGGDVLLMGPEASTPDVAGSLGRAAARALRTAAPRLVIAVGGDTAHGLCAALGVESLWAQREAAPGAPLLRCTLTDGRDLRLVMKSGSFGADDVLAQLVASA